MQNPNELFEKSKKLVPGGVHSPVRSFKGMGMPPRFVQKGKGAYIFDTEGKDYIDFCMSFGPLILGHADTEVKIKLSEALERGWSFGACETYSLELAEYLLERLPNADQIRFVNSGTEAVMTALRLARGYTKRNKIIKFNGCYHGHVDSMLIKAGSGLAGTAEASSAGVPEGIAEDTLILELGDTAELEKCFIDHKDQIAAIIVEPLPANNGLLKQSKEFLQTLRGITTKNNSLLIFDEVISGFRVGFEGMAGETNIRPDISTYGKIIGGGLPVGAIAGTTQVMQKLAPVGDVYQAGTLSANPLAMVGGLETLKKLTPENYSRLHGYSEKIVGAFRKWFAEYNNGEFAWAKMTTHGSLFWVSNRDDITRACDIPEDQAQKFAPLFSTLLSKGIYLAPNGYEVGFVSLAHDDSVIADLEKRLWS